MARPSSFLRRLCEEAIPLRYTAERLSYVQKRYPGRDPLEVVRERFEYEFNVLQSKEMCDYLLIVYDFIAWAKRNGIPMGPGRGSAAGSVISYLSGITDIEPLRFQLFFERFINPERVSYPDIDVDICMERRQEVIDYTVGKYGKERVAQIITFGTMKAKMAIRDVGRVLNVPLPRVNEIAALVPEDPGMTIEKALQMDVDFQRLLEGDEEARRLIEIARTQVLLEELTQGLTPEAQFMAHGKPASDGAGEGLVEAARGSLGHWLRIENGRIAGYQIIAPTTWNFSPRDAGGVPGPVEAALVGAEVREGETTPVAVQHIVRSFDPCMVCTVH